MCKPSERSHEEGAFLFLYRGGVGSIGKKYEHDVRRRMQKMDGGSAAEGQRAKENETCRSVGLEMVDRQNQINCEKRERARL